MKLGKLSCIFSLKKQDKIQHRERPNSSSGRTKQKLKQKAFEVPIDDSSKDKKKLIEKFELMLEFFVCQNIVRGMCLTNIEIISLSISKYTFVSLIKIYL